MAGGGSSILVRARLGSAGKGRGSSQGLTYDRFRGLDGSEGMPARALGGTSLRWPLRPLFRRTGRLARDTRDLGSSRDAVGRPRKVLWVTVLFGRGSSPWGVDGGRWCPACACTAGSLYSRPAPCLHDEGMPGLQCHSMAFGLSRRARKGGGTWRTAGRTRWRVRRRKGRHTFLGGRHEGGPAARCDNPPRKIPYDRLRPTHFGR
jgi:hypothetical protein